jgi:hypothetical protein
MGLATGCSSKSGLSGLDDGATEKTTSYSLTPGVYAATSKGMVGDIQITTLVSEWIFRRSGNAVPKYR